MTREMHGRRLHMMGIAGAGVSALAQIASAWGADVDGCDREPGAWAEHLTASGVAVASGHHPDHVSPGMELIVSSAIPPDHPEIAYARQLGIPVKLRGELLGELSRHRRTVVIAGAHGKSTTTAMLGHIAIGAGIDPTVMVGASVPELGGNVRIGAGDWLIIEGDESDRTLRFLTADIAVVTNIERDHHHTFATDDEVIDLFASWLRSLAAHAVVIAGPGRTVDAALERAGRSRCDTSAERFDDRIRDVIRLPGEHNVRNASQAIAAAAVMGIDVDQSLRSLGTFRGVGRRFDIVGACDGVLVVDDYAHHPTEVAATIAAARDHQRRTGHSGRVIVVFQPHLYSRTRELHQRFAEALALADVAFVLDVYGAREDPLPGVDSTLITRALEAQAPDVGRGVLTIDVATGDISTITREVGNGDCVITMGAGSVTLLAPRLLAELTTRHADQDAGRGDS